MAIGNIPVGQQQLIDGDFVNGITQGHNSVFQNGVSAAGTSSQAGATQLADRIAMFEVDTVGANSGVALPAALSGVSIFVANNTATNLCRSINNPCNSNAGRRSSFRPGSL